jgi:hypothetical protein
MALTSGFFNSINGDRRYDGIQMSSIFDGIIRDGVFMHLGTSMMVRASVGMQVTIGIGRAWFNHTWSLNDALYPIVVDQSEVILDRIDTIVLEVNSSLIARANSYKVIKGTPAINPVRPALVKSALVNQYPLCDVRVNRLVTVINQANITNRVGTGDCPFVTGPLTLMNIDALIAQWGDQWQHFYNAQVNYLTSTTEQLLAAWNDFYEKQTADISGQNEFWRKQWIDWYNSTTIEATQEMADWRIDRETTFDNWRNTEQSTFYNWRDNEQQTFDDWFAALQGLLTGNVEAEIAAAVADLQNRVAYLEETSSADAVIDLMARMGAVERFKDILSNEFKVLNNLEDSKGGHMLDSAGNEVEGQIIFCIKSKQGGNISEDC